MSQIPYSNKRYSVKCICEMNVNSCKCILFEHVKMHLLTIIVTSFFYPFKLLFACIIFNFQIEIVCNVVSRLFSCSYTRFSPS